MWLAPATESGFAGAVQHDPDATDVIILGGGPAGSAAALTLTAAGHRVLLLEKAHFPRFHIGESLLPYNLGLFDDLGVRELIADCGFPVKRAAQFWSGSGAPGARLEFAKGTYTEHPHAYQVERSRFDEKLLRHASAQGTEVREGCTYLSHERSAQGVIVRYREASGELRERPCSFLIDATGMTAVTARQAGLRQERAGHRKVALFGHFTGVERPSGEAASDIILLIRDRSWIWLIPLDDQRTSVGLVMDRTEFDAGRSDPEALWKRIEAETPELARRLSKATRLGPLHIEADYSFAVQRLVEPRLVRVGDAAGFLDPVFSSGVMLAMESGRAAALAVSKALRSGQPLTRDLLAYEREVRRHLALFWRFVQAFYTRPFIELLLQPQKHLNLLSAINAVLAGRSRLPWAARWRLEVFFGLVKLQRWLPVVPRLQWLPGRPPQPFQSEAPTLSARQAPITEAASSPAP